MKKIPFTVLLLSALVALLGSCKDDEKPIGGSFTFDGEKLTLKNGFSKDWGSETSGEDTYYYWGITLTSADISFDAEEGTMVGAGDMVYLFFAGVNTGESELPIGTFKYNANQGENFLDWGGIVLDYDSEGQSGDWHYDPDEGSTITITKSGSKYTIKFTLILANEETITGTFYGTLSEGYLPL